MELSGTFGFSQDVNVTFAPQPSDKRLAKAAAVPPSHLFQLIGPLETPVASVHVVPVAQAKKQQ
jgi:hypothetical protein